MSGVDVFEIFFSEIRPYLEGQEVCGHVMLECSQDIVMESEYMNIFGSYPSNFWKMRRIRWVVKEGVCGVLGGGWGGGEGRQYKDRGWYEFLFKMR